MNIGLIGLAVMGQNLALNMADHGIPVVVFNRTASVMDAFLAGPGHGAAITGARSLEDLVGRLARPRQVLLMIQAGPAVDSCIEQLLPLLEPGDILMDGGNSLHTDTTRRTRFLAEKGILFVGAGISGGEEGARRGPSIMLGGAQEAWPQIRDMFTAIAAQVDGRPCCEWVGPEGAGHFVKMVHNGIEYGDMQLICEAYDFMRRVLGLNATEVQSVFAQWNKGVLSSYLIEISAHIFGVRDSSGAPLVEMILDAAGQKGTGKWAVNAAQDLGVPLTLIGEAVFSRMLSERKDERVHASKRLKGPQEAFAGDTGQYLKHLHDALYAAKIVSYSQGYMLLQAAMARYGWKLDLGAIALLWRGGCIIRSAFLVKINAAFAKNPALENLLLDDFFQEAMHQAQTGWRKVVAKAVEHGVPTAALSSALAYYDGYRSANLPANLLQAQRDYFGAHTYERVDRGRGEFFHTEWAEGNGGAS